MENHAPMILPSMILSEYPSHLIAMIFENMFVVAQ